jgi:hypothetical protein
MIHVSKISFFFLIAGLMISSCKKDEADVSALPVKISHVANAGEDKIVILPADSVLLDGSGLVGTLINYKWSKISGPASFIIVDSNAAITKVTNMVLGDYAFELIVTDNYGLSSKDIVTVYVINSCTCIPDCDPWGDPCNPWDY